MLTIEVDSSPIHEGIARPESSQSQGVEFIEGPGVAPANTAWSIIEPNGKPLAGNVPLTLSSFKGPSQKRPVVVQSPGLDGRGLGATARTGRQRGGYTRPGSYP